jgi:uncharacterized protein (TIGR03086 family)
MRMDIISLHDRAVDETARLVDGVKPEQMDLPTPCAGWDVRVLLAHLVGGNMRWAALPNGDPLTRGPARGSGAAADLLGDDPAGAYRRSAAALQAAWRDPGLLDRQFEIPIGVMPGRVAFQVRLVETVVHGWDLAKATGQHPAFAPGIVETAIHFAQSSLPRERLPGSPFAPPVSVSDDLTEIDRLAALLGRTPG